MMFFAIHTNVYSNFTLGKDPIKICKLFLDSLLNDYNKDEDEEFIKMCLAYYLKAELVSLCEVDTQLGIVLSSVNEISYGKIIDIVKANKDIFKDILNNEVFIKCLELC